MKRVAVILGFLAAIAAFVLPVADLEATDIYVRGKLAYEGNPISNFPVIIEGESHSIVLSTNRSGEFSVVLPARRWQHDSYEIILPNAVEPAGEFSVELDESSWYMFWNSDSFSISTEHSSSGSQAQIEADVSVRGLGDVDKIRIEVDIVAD